MDRLKTAQNICQLRKEKNMTQKELAKKIYVTDKAVSKWERGMGSPDISTVPLLANALGVTADDILNGDCVSQLNHKNITNINPNDNLNRDGRFADFKNFLKMRRARIFFLLPVLWACLFGVIGILYLFAIFVAPMPADSYMYLKLSVLPGLLIPWFIISSVTGFIPLILCYVWHRLGQTKNSEELNGR